MTELEIGAYRIAVDEEKTARQYAALPPYAGNDMGVRLFRDCMKRLPEEAGAFLGSLGVDLRKLTAARPVAEPDENGEALFLCACRLCGTLLSPESSPRRSAAHAGLQLVFTGDPDNFTRSLADLSDPQLEMRFVVSLPFDPGFFDRV